MESSTSATEGLANLAANESTQMKIRNGFVANSSSSTFLIALNVANRHLANYNWLITEEETERHDTKTVWLDDEGKYKDVGTAEYLKIEGFIKIGRRYDYDIWERTRPIYNTLETGLGRATSICFGQDLLKYIDLLKEDNWTPNLLTAIENAIAKYGLNNVLLLRESDEAMGGLFQTN